MGCLKIEETQAGQRVSLANAPRYKVRQGLLIDRLVHLLFEASKLRRCFGPYLGDGIGGFFDSCVNHQTVHRVEITLERLGIYCGCVADILRDVPEALMYSLNCFTQV